VFRRLKIIALLAVLAGLAGLVLYGNSRIAPERVPVEFSIPAGSSLKTVARNFEAKGIIDQPFVFVLMARILGEANRIKAGNYLIDKPITAYQLLTKITSGETMFSKVTIVDGWSFRQMRGELDSRSDIRHDSTEMSGEAIMQAIGASETDPEGLFFPDTYYFDAGDSDLNIYRRAYHMMQKRLDAAWQSRAAGLPYATPYQALIMASIIEKETGAPEERPMIAAVFVNRMRIGMGLQSDPTVIYGMGSRYDGNIRKVDLETDTPYNTYTRRGLPPTPIALPGEAAIQAALHPADSRALYFVAKGNGRHHFSDTLEEHNKAVYRYQIKGGA